MSSSVSPQISVVIPTHNRWPELNRCLTALAAQTFTGDFEVVVVADGCTDGTVDELEKLDLPFTRQVLAQPSRGAAAARNAGARVARGPLLLFLDDDVIASPAVISAHVRQRALMPEPTAVVGPYLPLTPSAGDYFRLQFFDFWQQTFNAMGQPGHTAGYRDFVSGNLSITARAFWSVGGFDESFPSCGMEDYELGVRLLAAGVQLAYAPDASALHLDTTDIRRLLKRKFREGGGTVTLVDLHPEVLPTTRLPKSRSAARRLAFTAPVAAGAIERILQTMIEAAAALRLKPLWTKLNGHAQDLAFWRGVGHQLGGGGREFSSFIETIERRLRS